VDICKITDSCSVYKEGKCLGCDCGCPLIGSDELDILKEIYDGDFGDERDYDKLQYG